MTHQAKTILKTIIIFVATNIMVFGNINDYDLIAIVDCDQQAKIVKVHVIRDRNNIGERRAQELAADRLISRFLDATHDKAVFLWNETPDGINFRILWIRDGMVRPTKRADPISLDDYLDQIDVEPPNQLIE